MEYLKNILLLCVFEMPTILLAAGEGGFPEEATGLFASLRATIISIIGIICTIALSWQLALGFLGKKSWPDIFKSSLWVLGAVIGLVVITLIF